MRGPGGRWWSALAVLVLAAGAVAGWRVRRPDRGVEGARVEVQRPERIDAKDFRTQLAGKLDRAKRLAKQPSNAPTPVASAAPPAGKSPIQGTGPIRDAGKNLISPVCVLGPAELCESLADLILACDAGGASDCLAVGQFLAETPPRPLMAHLFFLQACRNGDPVGCTRYQELKSSSTASCDDDVFACAWRAYRTHDQALHDQACTLGVADACVARFYATRADPGRSRAYLAKACQLGSPNACMSLGTALRAGCIATDVQPCYPHDGAQARAAFEIACSVGWEAACQALATSP